MHYKIDGIWHDFISIGAFKTEHSLPDMWGVATFEPKHNPNLGSIDKAGAQLNQLRLVLLQNLQPVHTYKLLSTYDALGIAFERELRAINTNVGLSEAEIDFAVAGFSDANQAYAYAIIRAHTTHTPAPSFGQVYQDWLMDSVRLSQRIHLYDHQGTQWHIQTITDIYGRVGMKVAITPQMIYYVADKTQACPADGFMLRLMTDIAQKLTLL